MHCCLFSQALRLLLCRRICAPPEWNIRICDPITSYFVLLCSLMLAWHTRFSLLIFHLYLRFCVCSLLKQAVFLSGSKISYADLRFLYFIPADCKSAGTLALLVIINCNALAIATGHLDFSLFVLHSSLKYAFHFRKTHYVAIVPADLRSAGIEYKDL